MLDRKPIPEILIDDEIRFHMKVDRGHILSCWKWSGVPTDGGYGIFGVNNVSIFAHRVAYYLHYKIDPKELLVCHKCNNTICVNPFHLYLGTSQDNNQQAYDDGCNMGTKNQGTVNHFSKLTEEKVTEIKKLFKSKTNKEIAGLFNVTPSLIGYIKKNKIWRHIS